MKILKPAIIALLATSVLSCSSGLEKEISLDGSWVVHLDSSDIETSGTLIHLPGTLDDAGIGTKNTLQPELNNDVLSGLTRKHQHIGPAWYHKEIKVPKSWKDKKITLELERVIWESQLYVDGVKMGHQESLITPHRYNLSNRLQPGKHSLLIRIDNSNKYPLINVKGDKYPNPVNQDMAHAYTNHTQIKWNGVIGDLKLTASEVESITDLNVYPLIDQSKLKVTFKGTAPELDKLKYHIRISEGEKIVEGETAAENGEFYIPIPDEMEYWDELNPKLYELNIKLDNQNSSVKFGCRQIQKKDGILYLNGQRIFLRGNLECSIFPLTGHPPTEKAEWATLIDTAKAYGLNHLRFHSYCPPKAAFEAADEAGFYFQVELPHWSLRFGEDQKTTDFLLQEADNLLNEYGNHPSFIMMSLGNEIHGPPDLMNSVVADLRAQDGRHLYTTTSYSFQYPLGAIAQKEDDFLISQKTDKGWIRGQGIFNTEYPNFSKDYTETSEHVPVPLISHEIGQYAVYPDLSEIDLYTGVLKPLNFMAIKNALEEKNMLDLADDFTLASGKLAALLYKEEIERALKTPSFDGFQLLQLQDFPGQGTALVGLLNAFWKSKGIITAEEFRQFNAELVPLLRFKKAVYEHGEHFKASIEVANFYKKLPDQSIEWHVTNNSGEILYQGLVSDLTLPIGNNTNLGEIDLQLEAFEANKLNIKIRLTDTNYENSWSIWVYPEMLPEETGEVLVTSSLSEAETALKEGKSVLFNPDYRKLKGTEGRFVPVFWSPVHFPHQPSTMGLLMDPEHPAFDHFPTNFHTNWQWWDLCIHSKSLNIDSIKVVPLVRVIDNFVTNRNLANVFETKVGEGKLILSSADLMNNLETRPVARQLRFSLLQYMNSDAFNPIESTEFETLKALTK